MTDSNSKPALYLPEISAPRPEVLGGGQWDITHLSPITVLMGRNGVGKSILLRSIRDQRREDLHYISPERAGDLSFSTGFVDNQMTGQARANVTSTNFANQYHNNVVGRIQVYLNIRGARESTDGAPLPPSELESVLHELIPEFDIRVFDKITSRPFKFTRLVHSTSINSGIHDQTSLSSGELQVISLAMDILLMSVVWELQEHESRVILIDEPDAHLHPDLQVLLSRFICSISERFGVQFLVATHSTTLLSSLGQYGRDRASVVYMNRARPNQRAVQFSRYMREMSACLGGHVLMGTLFGAPILLVEGDDDFLIWSHVARGGKVRLAVIPCNGDELPRYQRDLEQIFASLASNDSQPRGYALIDGDKPSPQSADAARRLVPTIQLQCHEAENLYITDELLTRFGLDWPQACEKIRSSAGRYPERENILLGVANLSSEARRRAEIKPVIAELAAILDPQQEGWTIRLGRYLAAHTPSGQLADFLGAQVVAALWPET